MKKITLTTTVLGVSDGTNNYLVPLGPLRFLKPANLKSGDKVRLIVEKLK